MKVKNIVTEDFVNYKIPSMFIATCVCDWKCCIEQSLDVSICQNHEIISQPDIDISPSKIYHMYITNNISNAIIFGGLEPILQFNEMLDVIKYFRKNNINDMIIIYTGYYQNEIKEQIKILQNYKNIIIKFGRYQPNNKPHYDETLGVDLISDNQYAIKIS
jgi:hypothetical protein